LNALVEEAITGSPTLRAADARVRRAVALSAAVGAARYPQVTGNADVTRQRSRSTGSCRRRSAAHG